MGKDNEALIRSYGKGTIAKLARDPFDRSITRGELREEGGKTGWYRASVLSVMQSSNLSIVDVRRTLQKSKGKNARTILKAIQDL